MTATELLNKIRSEIERLKDEHKEPTFRDDEYESGGVNGYQLALTKVISFLDTLQVDEPEGLDEAAEKYVETQDLNFLKPEIVKRIFKAGAEWMAGQGETIDGSLCYDPHLQMVIVFLEDCPKMWEGSIMDVTVQIRKKED